MSETPHQSLLAPSENKFHVGNGDDGKHYWLSPAADIARQFGCSPTNIWQIHAGKAWSNTKPRKRVFTVEEVHLIRRTPWQEKSAAQFAEEFGVGVGAIERIRQFKSYRYVEAECSQHSRPDRGAL